MRRFRELDHDDQGGGIDMSPMIDCVFILLIFFVVTTTFVEETGIEVDKPEAASSIKLEKQSLMLAVTADGQVFFDGADIGIGGVRPLVSRKMAQEKVPVIVLVDAAARADTLTRVIDEAKLGNAEKVSIATKKAAP
jgi:biopolymer transport protein ExbD